MLQKLILPVVAAVMLLCFTACGKEEPTVAENEKPAIVEKEESAIIENDEAVIYLYAGENRLEILPADNSSAESFIEMLVQSDITVDMHDYGNFEKVGELGADLPINDENITTEPGDVILYQGNTITIYYNTNTWNFTRLGKVQNISQQELKEILGEGDVSVTFSFN